MTRPKWCIVQLKRTPNGAKSVLKELRPMEKSNEMGYTIRTKEEFESVAQNIKSEISQYSNTKSRWSGTINVEDKLIYGDSVGVKEWLCDVSVVNTADDGVVWHEMLHSCPVSNYDVNVYTAYEYIEEGTVEFLKQQICSERSIANIPAYEDKVIILKTINDTFGYRTDLEFAKEIFNIPLPDRYQWLEDKVDKSLRECNASEGDKQMILGYTESSSMICSAIKNELLE